MLWRISKVFARLDTAIYRPSPSTCRYWVCGQCGTGCCSRWQHAQGQGELEGYGETVQVKMSLLSIPSSPLYDSLSFSIKPHLSSDQDVVQMVSNLAGNFEGVVQYNKDNTAFEVSGDLVGHCTPIYVILHSPTHLRVVSTTSLYRICVRS